MVDLFSHHFRVIIINLGDMFSKNICHECGPLPKNHFSNYIESFLENVLPGLPENILCALERLFVGVLMRLNLLRRVPYEPSPKISLRSSVFITEGIKRGFSFWTINGPFGPVGRFQMLKAQRLYFFEGLPRAEFFNTRKSALIDDKAKVKEILLDLKLPTPHGRCFNLFQFRAAVKYGLNLGFPLVVKPRSGSISRHVITNVCVEKELSDALKKVFSYEPHAIIERFLPNVKTYRATVVDFTHIAVVERIPAHIVGDGVHTIQELIDVKNNDLRRGKPKQKDTTLYQLVIDATTFRLLKENDYDFHSIPKNKEHIFLQKKVILDLGADLIEVSNKIHPDNHRLFEKISRAFNTRLVGIDFLAEDIARSWNKQRAVIIELNSLPYIDMHHFPTEGIPVNVGGLICDLVEKYY